jgi:hypothetical protein
MRLGVIVCARPHRCRYAAQDDDGEENGGAAVAGAGEQDPPPPGTVAAGAPAAGAQAGPAVQGPGQAQAVPGRDSSVCDRLRNATLRVVRDVHRLMGDPEVVGTLAPQLHRDKYYEGLDKLAMKLLSQCKQWKGGSDYHESKKCATLHCVFYGLKECIVR